MGNFRPLFLYYRLVNTVLPMTGFERGPTVSEATALPTEPQPLHKQLKLFEKSSSQNLSKSFKYNVLIC